MKCKNCKRYDLMLGFCYKYLSYCTAWDMQGYCKYYERKWWKFWIKDIQGAVK